jgi:hypothetical protein
MRTRKPPSAPPELPEPQDPTSAEAPPDERVGFCRPPVGSQFKPGQSGNPRGRPKGSKGIDQVLRQALERRVPDPRGGRRTVRMLDIIVDGIVLSAARRDPRMLRLLLTLIDRYGPSEPQRVDFNELREGDRQILEEFIASITTTDQTEDKDP